MDRLKASMTSMPAIPITLMSRSPPSASLSIPPRESSLASVPSHPAMAAGESTPTTRPASQVHPLGHTNRADRHQDDGQGHLALNMTESQMANGWDAAVGKAGLGKTGRVINRLVSDNEALKRDLKIERLKAEESRQAARLLEDKMERIVSDYESRLLEASVTKTLLSRKERQVESLQSTLDLERKRAVDAQDRERTWRDEVERVRSETKRQVEDATSHATLMEGRYNTISSHWRDQGDEVKKAMVRMGKEIHELLEERASDDDKIAVLREICDQQDGNIRDLQLQKEDMTRKFQEYKAEQESSLRDIKEKASAREAEQERTLEETREVLNKLKWALNIKSSLDWSE
jgi:hypothetical protein